MTGPTNRTLWADVMTLYFVVTSKLIFAKKDRKE